MRSFSIVPSDVSSEADILPDRTVFELAEFPAEASRHVAQPTAH